MLQQGMVLLAAGMGIAVSFLALLALITSILGKLSPYIRLFPEPAPKKVAAPAPAADEAIAIAIAVANNR